MKNLGKIVTLFSRLEHNGLLPKLQSVAAFGKSKEKKKDSGREIVGLDEDSDVEEITSKKPGTVYILGQ